MSTPSSASLKTQFLAPLHRAFAGAANRRNCRAISDLDWLVGGVQRCLENVSSGRDMVQKFGLWERSRSTYFESLKSKRRLDLIEEIARVSETFFCQRRADVVSRHLIDLEGFDIYAGDGHWHGHAARDRPRNLSGKKYATGHLYGLNLRTGFLRHLITNNEEKKKEHDISAIKRLGPEAMRMGAKKGTKVLWIWDRAGIDFAMWHHWKTTKGIYFISREKENMKLEVIGENAFDREAAINGGVVRDQLVGAFVGTTVRRIEYVDAATRKTFRFVTTLTCPKVSPGTIVALYRMRWDIEKAFDDVKNKFNEQKAWASSETAKTIQAELICLTWNLLRSFEAYLEEKHNLTNHSETRRKKKRLNEEEKKLKNQGRCLERIVGSLQRTTQISVKLIRWIRYRVWNEDSDDYALEELRALYAKL